VTPSQETSRARNIIEKQNRVINLLNELMLVSTVASLEQLFFKRALKTAKLDDDVMLDKCSIHVQPRL